MTFTITAELPLGTYRAAGSDGRAEPVPSVSRLYSALLCAAGFGPRAVPSADSMKPCYEDEVALRWLEDHPPDGISLPAIEVNTGNATAYRDDGTIKKTKTAMSTKKLAKSPDLSVAVAGRFAWTWSQPPPPEVIGALEALCPDVPYLGTTESPVRLAISSHDAEPTHFLDQDVGLFGTAGGRDIELPAPGRYAELVRTHKSVTDNGPSKARDKWSTDESSGSHVPPRDAVALARYSPRQPSQTDVPWPDVLLLPLDRQVPESYRVGLAVAAHRALIRAIGDGAPPLITGIYPTRSRPANRLAIQILDTSMPVDTSATFEAAALALMIPQGAEPTDLAALARGLSAMTSVRGPGGRLHRIVGQARRLSGGNFWRAKQPGRLRLWRTTPAAVPDTRGGADVGWTFAHAALLSLGFVWKDSLPQAPGRGEQRYLSMVDAVNAAGAAVVRAHPLRTSDVQHYVHKVNDHAVIRPYRADLWLGDLCDERTVQAIGQTRHLGGGLLVPFDVPNEVGAL